MTTCDKLNKVQPSENIAELNQNSVSFLKTLPVTTLHYAAESMPLPAGTIIVVELGSNHQAAKKTKLLTKIWLGPLASSLQLRSSRTHVVCPYSQPPAQFLNCSWRAGAAHMRAPPSRRQARTACFTRIH
jgi:hypothetical protein